MRGRAILEHGGQPLRMSAAQACLECEKEPLREADDPGTDPGPACMHRRAALEQSGKPLRLSKTFKMARGEQHLCDAEPGQMRRWRGAVR